jgi:hypothetical protein
LRARDPSILVRDLLLAVAASLIAVAVGCGLALLMAG